MMIDFEKENLLTLTAAARLVPNRKSSRGVNVSTVWRWAGRGSHGVRLETILIGGVRHTSREALGRFFAATTAAADEVTEPDARMANQRRTISRRQMEIEAAERELAAA